MREFIAIMLMPIMAMANTNKVVFDLIQKLITDWKQLGGFAITFAISQIITALYKSPIGQSIFKFIPEKYNFYVVQVIGVLTAFSTLSALDVSGAEVVLKTIAFPFINEYMYKNKQVATQLSNK